jgi:glycosyltransferase 2 family protein
MGKRARFVRDALRGYVTVLGLCERHGESGKTGYKWIAQLKSEGASERGSSRVSPPLVAVSPGPMVRTGAKVLFAAAVVYYLAFRAPIGEVGATLLRVNLWYLLLALSVVPVSAWLIAARQKVLTDWQGLSLSIRQIMQINLVTRYYDLLLPAYVSGVTIRWPRMARKDGKPVETLAAIAFNRFLTMVTVVLLATLFWYPGRPDAFASWIGILLIGLLFGTLAFYPVFFNRALAARYCRMLERGWLAKLPGPLRRRAASFATAAGHFQGLPVRTVAWLGALSLLRGLTVIISFVFLAWALGLALSFAAAGWVRSMLKLAGIVPFSVMGVGLREVGLVVLLPYFGISTADAVALSLLLVARNLAKALAGGMLELREGSRRGHRTAKTSS